MLNRLVHSSHDLFCILLLGASLNISALHAQSSADLTVPRPMPPASVLVVGMMGGIERWNGSNRPVRQLVLDLRSKGIYAESIEHRHKALTIKLIKQALDTNQDGKLDEQERAHARIILFGHSMGAASVVSVAKSLNKLHIPVLLTIQVDSIGSGAGVIPPNVAKAANFYQRDSHLLRGREKIRAEDPEKTTILGNYRYSYKDRDVDLSNITMPERIAGGAHTKMEFDPEVWSEVEKLILVEARK